MFYHEKFYIYGIFYDDSYTSHVYSLEDFLGLIAKHKFAQIIHRVIQTQIVNCHQKLYQFQRVKLTVLEVVLW